MMPDADLVREYRESGGDGKPAQAGFKVCHATSAAAGLETAHRIWPNMGLPGELAQVLPSPRHFEQASELVTPETLAGSLPCGPDPEPYVATVRQYADAGFDEVYVQQVGPDQDAFFEFWRRQVQPAIGDLAPAMV